MVVGQPVNSARLTHPILLVGLFKFHQLIWRIWAYRPQNLRKGLNLNLPFLTLERMSEKTHVPEMKYLFTVPPAGVLNTWHLLIPSFPPLYCQEQAAIPPLLSHENIDSYTYLIYPRPSTGCAFLTALYNNPLCHFIKKDLSYFLL